MDTVRTEFKKREIPAHLLKHFTLKKQNRWICRNEIIWYKRNCMPSSASDRFTVDFEKIFFFTKQGKYWFEQQFEPHQECSIKARAAKLNQTTDPGASMSAVNVQLGDKPRGDRFIPPQGRNMRCVWGITTHGFKEAHFATFPEALPERIIKAGCPKEICKKCGKAREKITERVPATSKECPKTQAAHEARGGVGNPVGTLGKSGSGRIDGYTKELGYTDCGCGEKFEPGVTLDPFFGSGTTGVVAKKLGRNFLGIELNPAYITMAEKRIAETVVQNQMEGL